MENKKEKIFENTYVAINIKTKKSPSMMKVTTDEYVSPLEISITPLEKEEV